MRGQHPSHGSPGERRVPPQVRSPKPASHPLRDVQRCATSTSPFTHPTMAPTRKTRHPRQSPSQGSEWRRARGSGSPAGSGGEVGGASTRDTQRNATTTSPARASHHGTNPRDSHSAPAPLPRKRMDKSQRGGFPLGFGGLSRRRFHREVPRNAASASAPSEPTPKSA